MTRRSRFTALAAIMLVASAPVAAQDLSGAERQYRLVPDADISTMIACLEGEGRTLISAHRGGPSPGLPENAIPTMDALLTAIPAIMEVDVAQSRDGVHFLMHDRTLDRTTTGSGVVAEHDWEAIRQLRLRDASGWVTPYTVPTLRETLDWVKGRTPLQIDFKRSTSYEAVISLVRETGNANNVILIAYSIEVAVRLHALAPEMLISLSIDAPGDLAGAQAAGIPADRIIAFTGTRVARPDLYAELEIAGVEVIFGTLGRAPDSLDNVIDRLGIDARYAELGEQGVDVLATDRPREAAVALAAAQGLPEAGQCGVGRAN